MHIYGIYKNGSEEFIYREAMEKKTENRLMDIGRGDERVRCMERVTWKLILPYVKQIANGNLLRFRCLRQLKQWGGMGREMGGMFKRERICVYLWLIHVDV